MKHQLLNVGALVAAGGLLLSGCSASAETTPHGRVCHPSDRSDSHRVYYRDDESGDVHPVNVAPGVTREQFIQQPRAVLYEAARRFQGCILSRWPGRVSSFN